LGTWAHATISVSYSDFTAFLTRYLKLVFWQ